MSAVYQMENKEYKKALDNLLKTKIIYEKISNYKDTLEAIIYKERVSQIDTLLRLCQFHLKGSSQAPQSAEDETKQLDTQLHSFPQKS